MAAGETGLGAGNSTEHWGEANARDVLCSRDPKAATAPAVAQALWIKVHHLSGWGGRLFPPSPHCRKKSLIQAIENICKNNYLPRALPGALPRPCPRLGFLQRGCFPGHTQRAGLRRCWQRCLDNSSPSSHWGPACPSPALAWVVRPLRSHPGSPSQPTCSRGVLCIPLLDLGSLPGSFPPSHPAGSGTGVTGTLRPGCFPINCYFLIPLAVRRAACWLRLLRAGPPLDARQPAVKGGGTRHARLPPAECPSPPCCRCRCRCSPGRCRDRGLGPRSDLGGCRRGTGWGRWPRDTALSRAGLRGAEPSRAVPS